MPNPRISAYGSLIPQLRKMLRNNGSGRTEYSVPCSSGCVRGRKMPVPMMETVLLGLLDRRRCGGELLIIGLNRSQNFWVYLVFNGSGCSPDGIFDRNRRTRSMSNDTDPIYAEKRHATVLLIIGPFPYRLECTFGELCAELATGFLKSSSLNQENIAWATASWS